MAFIKLLKLLYLAEREALAKWGESISGDHFVSMPMGPVLSRTYDLIKGHTLPGEVCPWQEMIKDESNYEVSLLNDIDIEDLDELSPAEIKILNDTFNEFGRMSRFEIVDFTHSKCPEWEDPHGSSYPISIESIFRAMGKDDIQIKKLSEKHHEQQQLDRIKSQLI